jgi:hypothetical protein
LKEKSKRIKKVAVLKRNVSIARGPFIVLWFLGGKFLKECFLCIALKISASVWLRKRIATDFGGGQGNNRVSGSPS